MFSYGYFIIAIVHLYVNS